MADMAYREIHIMNSIEARKLLKNLPGDRKHKRDRSPMAHLPPGGTQVGAPLPGRGRGGAEGSLPQTPPLPPPDPS
jgi:hypothetical protein